MPALRDHLRSPPRYARPNKNRMYDERAWRYQLAHRLRMLLTGSIIAEIRLNEHGGSITTGEKISREGVLGGIEKSSRVGGCA